MRRAWFIILALLFVAATTEENRLYRVAEAAFNDRLYDIAEKQFGEFVQKFPESERADNAQLFEAEAQVNQGKSAAAIQTLQDALKKWPDKQPDAVRFWLAEALARDGRFAEAATQYSEVIQQFSHSPYRPQAVYGLAFAQLRQNQMDAATKTLDLLPNLNPKSELEQEAELLRGQILLAQEKYAQADAVFNDVTKRFPNTRSFYRALYWLGKSAAERKQYDDALKAYSAVLDSFKAKPNKPVDAQSAAETWFAAGWAYWNTENFDSAADAFSSALNSAQTPKLKRDALLKLGESYVKAGNLTNGVTNLQEFLKAHPNDPLADEVQMAIARLWFGHEDYEAALPEYVQLITRYPQSPLVVPANLDAGWSASKLGKNDDALKFFQQAFTLAKDDRTAAEALFKVADTQFALNQYADAVASYQRLIGTYPETKMLDRAMFQLGEAYRELRNADGAIATFTSLVKQFPASPFAPEAQFAIGQIAVAAGKEEEARAAFGEVVSKFPDNDWAKKAALSIGQSFFREGKYDQALAEFGKCMTGGLGSELAAQAFYSSGLCYAKKGQSDKTLADFTDFLKKNPQATLAPDIQFWIGDYYQGHKDYAKAQEQFQSLVEVYPDSKRADTAQYFAARAAYSRQDYKAAIDLFEALFKKFPDSSWRCDARFAQGDALVSLGQFGDALLMFKNLVEQFPDCDLVCEAQGRKGDCQYTLNLFDESIVSYQKALDCTHDTTMRNQALFKIGQSYEKAGKLEDALPFYTKPMYEAAVDADLNAPRERFWSCKAEYAAAGVKEELEQWRDAITLYQKLVEYCPEMKPVAEDRIRKIRVAHGILF